MRPTIWDDLLDFRYQTNNLQACKTPISLIATINRNRQLHTSRFSVAPKDSDQQASLFSRNSVLKPKLPMKLLLIAKHSGCQTFLIKDIFLLKWVLSASQKLMVS